MWVGIYKVARERHCVQTCVHALEFSWGKTGMWQIE